MAEADVIRRTERPATVRTLRADLLRLGLAPGIVTICHSSLSSMGWVCGGAVAVIQALESAMSDRGTLVMPTFSPELSEPSLWGSRSEVDFEATAEGARRASRRAAPVFFAEGANRSAGGRDQRGNSMPAQLPNRAPDNISYTDGASLARWTQVH
jgi:hypothetical protein